jgi:nucleotide-binding universal stress UspA family protein
MMHPNHDPAPQGAREDRARKHGGGNRALPGRLAVSGLWKGFHKVALFLVSVSLFIVAIELLKGGARGAAPLIESRLGLDSLPNALGFGWFAAYLLMSGSPVAAISLTFLDAGVLDQLQSFAMISGSRLGASFMVLFIGFLYVLRGHERRTGLTMGLLSLVVTGSIYLPALVVGSLLLSHHALDRVQLLDRGAALSSALDRVFEPVVRHGLVVDEILAEASEGDHDLIVIGAHQAEGLMRFLLDDVAHQIIGHADRPILVARTRSMDGISRCDD